MCVCANISRITHSLAIIYRSGDLSLSERKIRSLKKIKRGMITASRECPIDRARQMLNRTHNRWCPVTRVQLPFLGYLPRRFFALVTQHDDVVVYIAPVIKSKTDNWVAKAYPAYRGIPWHVERARTIDFSKNILTLRDAEVGTVTMDEPSPAPPLIVPL